MTTIGLSYSLVKISTKCAPALDPGCPGAFTRLRADARLAVRGSAPAGAAAGLAVAASGTCPARAPGTLSLGGLDPGGGRRCRSESVVGMARGVTLLISA